jgi:hypothetical protein
MPVCELAADAVAAGAGIEPRAAQLSLQKGDVGRAVWQTAGQQAKNVGQLQGVVKFAGRELRHIQVLHTQGMLAHMQSSSCINNMHKHRCMGCDSTQQ